MKIRIDKLIKGGLGLGRLDDGRAVMLPRVLPGELVRPGAIRDHRQYLKAEVAELLESSPHRISPACPVYQGCGGCDLLHLAYPEQLRLKNTILLETLVRAGLGTEDDLRGIIGPPLASPAPFNYRQRVRLQVVDGLPGYFGRRSRELVPVSSCLLAAEPLNRLLGNLLGLPFLGDLLAGATALELLDDPGGGRQIVLIHVEQSPRPAKRSLARRCCQVITGLAAVIFAAKDQMIGPFLGANGEIDPRSLHLSLPLPAGLSGKETSLCLEPGSFCQVNPDQNLRCIELLLEWAEGLLPGFVVDLFCGMGNFSIPLALQGARVRGVDLKRASVRSAVRNAAAAGVSEHCEFAQESAEAAVRRLLAEGAQCDLLLLDPPRSGCGRLINLLPGLAARRIVVISCDPATLARDLGGLVKMGYALREVRMVDMFPQTAEQESMALLEAVGRG